ncbi:hypothetical protein [Maridesulfovibrio sp.]|uniref:hypothetical protein n=1 Tax=unclassified Maridesulfovibrio TaxID=2794999 RepID=UPI003B00F803
MINENDYLNGEEKRIAEEIQKMELRDVPPTFSDSVMNSIKKEKTPWWKKILQWINSPIELRLTPLRVGLTVSLALLVIFLFPRGEQVHPPAANVVSVHFEFKAPYDDVQKVSVIGSFNDWSAESASMHYDNTTGIWIYETNLQPGDHEYVFLVNGNIVVPDPKANHYRKDGFGSINSIVSVRSNEHAI